MHVFVVGLMQPTTKLAFEQWVREGDNETKELLQRISRTREELVSALTRSTPDAALRVRPGRKNSFVLVTASLTTACAVVCVRWETSHSMRTFHASWVWYEEERVTTLPCARVRSLSKTCPVCAAVQMAGLDEAAAATGNPVARNIRTLQIYLIDYYFIIY